MNNFKALIVLVIAGSIACSSPENEKGERSSLGVSYEIDTVMVDAGDHFFFLNWNLGISDISADKKILFNLNPQTLLLEVVDLDNLKLMETIQLEKEGPNGVGGGFINRLQVLENGHLLLFNFNKISEIDSKGNLIKNHEFNKETIKGYEWEETDALDNYGRFSPDGKLFMTRLVDEDYQKPSKGLAIIDVESGMMKAIKTDAFSKLDQYRISMVSEGGRSSMFAGESVFMDFDDDHFIVSNSAINEVYYYDFKSDSLFHKKFESSLTANERVINYPQTTETPEEFQKVMRQKMEQVQFARLIPQPKENLFWRFTRDQDRKIADSVVYKNVLTFFDSDYKMIHEEKVDQVPNSRISFFKDGMLYSFVNIDDELAFIRTKATISKN